MGGTLLGRCISVVLYCFSLLDGYQKGPLTGELRILRIGLSSHGTGFHGGRETPDCSIGL